MRLLHDLLQTWSGVYHKGEDKKAAQQNLGVQSNRQDQLWQQNYQQYQPGAPPPSNSSAAPTGGRTEPPPTQRGGLSTSFDRGRPTGGAIDWNRAYEGIDRNNPNLAQIVANLNRQGVDAEIAHRGRSGTRKNPDGTTQMSGDKVIADGRMYDIIIDSDGNPQLVDNPRPRNAAGTDPYAPTGGGGFPGGYAGGSSGLLDPALAGYNEFLQTGGLSPQNIQDIRARAAAPTRAIYSNMQDELERSRNLSGGYMPNFGAASAKLAREGSNRIGDISVNTEAMLAEAIRQGRMGGMQGLSNLGLGINSQGLQSAQLGLGLSNAQSGVSQMPGGTETTLGRIGQISAMAAPYVLAPFTGGASLLAAPMTAGLANRGGGGVNPSSIPGMVPSAYYGGNV